MLVKKIKEELIFDSGKGLYNKFKNSLLKNEINDIPDSLAQLLIQHNVVEEVVKENKAIKKVEEKAIEQLENKAILNSEENKAIEKVENKSIAKKKKK